MIFRYYRFRRTTLISLGCAGFLVGLGLARIGWIVEAWWLLATVPLGLVCVRQRLPAIGAVVTIGLLIGLWRGGDTISHMQIYRQFVGQKVSVSGVIASDPTYGSKGEQVFLITQAEVSQGAQAQRLPGQIRVTTFNIADVRRDDRVIVSGKLRDGFGNYQAELSFANLDATSPGQNAINDIRYTFAAGVYNALPEPQASLGLGFLAGIRSQLPDTLDDQLRIVGLTHIVVASGYNLTILVRLARRLFARYSAFMTVAVSGVLIGGFTLVTGFSPSMNRAALVTGLALAAWYYGRRVHPMVLLLLSAAVTAAINPLYLWSDIGWWLSFLAFAGVLLLAPLLQKRFFGEREPKLIGQVLLETLSAQILTLPLILLVFGKLSILALPANLLIVPLIPLAMVCTFVAGVAGVLMPALAGYIALPATWLLTFITEVVRLLAGVSWASVPVHLAIPVMLASYGLILTVMGILWRKTRFNFLRTSVIE